MSFPTVIITGSHGKCPECECEFDVKTPKDQGAGDAKRLLGVLPSKLHLEIITAYMKDPEIPYTTRDIINRINVTRHFNEITKRVERTTITREHSELASSILGVIELLYKDGKDRYYKINQDRAHKLLRGGSF
jgi:hypothetical protein